MIPNPTTGDIEALPAVDAGGPRHLPTTHGALLVALVAAAANWNVLLNRFAWDDAQNILQNRWVREPARVWEAFGHHLAGFDPSFDSSYYRPVMHLVFAGTYAVAGLRPWAFHLVNLAAHAAMSACVYLILVRWAAPAAGPETSGSVATSRRGWELLVAGPFVAALLFAVHPVHTQAVAWIAGIVDLSYSLFFAVAFLWATYEGPRRFLPLAAAPAAFFLALLSKEPAVMLLPVVAIAFALRGALTDPARRREALVRVGALTLAFMAYLPLRINALGGLMRGGGRTELGAEDGVATALVLVGGYLKLVVAPLRLSALREFEVVRSLIDPRALLALAAVAAFAAAVWALRRRASALLGAALFVLPLLPALYVPVLGTSAGAERYLYLPSAGAALILSAAIEAWQARGGTRIAAVRLATAALATVLLAAATAASLAQNAVWRDDVTLWSDTVAKVPRSAPAHEALGGALLLDGKMGPAIAELEHAVALDPTNRDARVNLASALVAHGRVEEGLAAAQEGVRWLPNIAEAHAILGAALTAKGRLPEAIAAYERSLSLNPSIASVRNGAAFAYAQLGRKDLALAHLREAIRLQPENPTFRQNLALLAGP